LFISCVFELHFIITFMFPFSFSPLFLMRNTVVYISPTYNFFPSIPLFVSYFFLMRNSLPLPLSV
jgi:hypothetical protein